MIKQVIPVLPTLNINETILFYKDVLGFSGIDKGSYALLKKENAELHFELCFDKMICQNTSCCIKVTDVQCLYAEIAAKGIIYPQNKLRDLPGHQKGFTLKDNNGILLHFVQES